jgi:hypothetical protein
LRHGIQHHKLPAGGRRWWVPPAVKTTHWQADGIPDFDSSEFDSHVVRHIPAGLSNPLLVLQKWGCKWAKRAFFNTLILLHY